MFEEYINKKVKLLIDVEGKNFTYIATILEVSIAHIKFLDKNNQIKIFKIEQVMELTEIKEGDNNG